MPTPTAKRENRSRMQATAEAICRQIYDETRVFYAAKERMLGDAARGFRILHAPPVIKAPTLFLGTQPGGTLETAVPGGQQDWPKECMYLSEFGRLGSRLREIWGIARLRHCTGLNANFFRAPSTKVWGSVPKTLRGEIEAFCRIRAETIVRALAPQRIVIIGLRTFGRLTSGSVALTGERRVLVKTGILWGAPAFGIIHISGARVSRDDLDRLAAYFVNSP